MTNRIPRGLVIFFAVIGVIALSPIILGLAVGAIALAIGLAGALFKAAAVVFVIWAAVMILKGIFGSKPSPATKLPVSASGIGTADLVDTETNFERERRESLAELDRELSIAVAQKKPSES